jgi:hypothetical protein
LNSAPGNPAGAVYQSANPGRNSWTLVLRVVLPQLLSRLLTSLRLLLGSAWLFLISAEAISATAGLGYRIFLVRRYMAMDVIIPYVMWITLLAWLMDLALRQLHKTCFPWAEGGRHEFYRHQQYLAGVRRPCGAGTPQFAVKEGSSARWSARPAAGNRLSCACCWGRKRRVAAPFCFDGKPLAGGAGPQPWRGVSALFRLSPPQRAG